MELVFVDDEPQILDSIKRSLRKHRHQFATQFFTSPKQALRYIEDNKVFAVISDMKMAEMDGASLLYEVKKLSPEIIRIILSGEASAAEVARSLLIMHQYYSKPCDIEVLVSRLMQIAQINSIVDEKMKQAILSQDNLPIQPRIYIQILEIAKEPNSSVEDVANLIEQDLGLVSKILSIANSSFFSLSTKSHALTIKEAVGYLGIDMISNIVLHFEVLKTLSVKIANNKYFTALSDYALSFAGLCSILAKKFDASEVDIRLAYQAGLFNSLGIGVLLVTLEQQYIDILDQALIYDQTLAELSLAALAITHGEVAAIILASWGFPTNIIESLLVYHDEQKSLSNDIIISKILRLVSNIYPYPKQQIILEALDQANLSDIKHEVKLFFNIKDDNQDGK